MSLFNATLFINGLPVDYSVSKEKEIFFFEPFFNPHFDLEAPPFSVQFENGNFTYQNLDDQNLEAQVEEILKEYFEK